MSPKIDFFYQESKHSEFQYPCEMCDYKGRRPDHLVAHQRRVHKKMVTSEHVRLNNCVNSEGQHVQSEKKTPVIIYIESKTFQILGLVHQSVKDYM